VITATSTLLSMCDSPYIDIMIMNT
jgi:triosephosphate isomerase